MIEKFEKILTVNLFAKTINSSQEHDVSWKKNLFFGLITYIHIDKRLFKSAAMDPLLAAHKSILFYLTASVNKTTNHRCNNS